MGLAGLGLSNIQQAVISADLTVFSGEFPEGEHDSVWRAARAAHPQTGLWPVLDWTADQAAESTRQWPAGSHGRTWLAQALTIDPAERMALLIKSQLEFSYPADPEDGEHPDGWRDEFDPERLAAIIGAPATTPPPGIRLDSGAEYPPTHLLLVPANAGYEVPALVPDMLTPSNWIGAEIHPDLKREDHIAVLRHWHERYGADFYLACGVWLELAVSRPPRGRHDIAQCAIEQVSYCDDMYQILGGAVDVARKQAPADHWSFWWD